MNTKSIILLILVVSAFAILAVMPALGADFEDNKCFDEWTWCNDGTEDENAYWWEAGWCAAAIEAGYITGTIEDCTSSPDDDYIPPVEEDEEEKEKETKYCQIGIGSDDSDDYMVFKKTNHLPEESDIIGVFEGDPGYKECPWVDELKT